MKTWILITTLFCSVKFTGLPFCMRPTVAVMYCYVLAMILLSWGVWSDRIICIPMYSLILTFSFYILSLQSFLNLIICLSPSSMILTYSMHCRIIKLFNFSSVLSSNKVKHFSNMKPIASISQLCKQSKLLTSFACLICFLFALYLVQFLY